MNRLFFLLLVLTIAACKESPIGKPMDAIAEGVPRIIHIAHTRDTDLDGKINDEISEIPFENYEIILHGGDVDWRTTLEEEYIAAWDTIFHFDSPNTLWAIGNHDTDNRDLIENYTNRPSYYSYQQDNITFLVLDSQLDKSKINGEQLDWLETEIAALSDTKYLLVLTHKLIWMPGNEDLEPQIDDVANGDSGDCNYCTNPNNFYDDIYPKLCELQTNGVEVICIAGDIGTKVKSFEYLTRDNIQYLASGVATNTPGNEVLVFYWEATTQTLDWCFEFVENL